MQHGMSKRLGRWVAISATAALTAGFVAAGTAGASTAPRANNKTTVPQGFNPTTAAGATSTGATAANTELTVSFVLKARHVAQLETKVDAGWKGKYLSTTQFAKAYGQSAKVVNDLESYLGSYGITTSAYADRLDVTAKGTAAQFNRALSISLDNYRVPGHKGTKTQHVYASRRDPKVSRSLGSYILSILGLTNYAPFASNASKAVGRRASQPSATSQIPAGEHTPADFIKHYHLKKLESTGALGQGQTLGIVTLASLNPSVPTEFWNILGLSTPADRITLDNIDGGAGPVSLTAGSDETTLDVEQSGAIAPQSHINVYQAPNTDYGFVDAYYAAASANVASSVSSSWGESETLIQITAADGTESPTYAQSFDEAYLEMAAQGQSNFTSSADEGAYTATSDAATSNLSTDNPASSPYVTAAGGTTLAGTQTYGVTNSAGAVTATESATIPTELAWSSDYLWPLYAALGEPSQAAAATNFGFDSGSGGGYSVLDSRPSYQNGVSGLASYKDRQYLTPTKVTDAQGIPLPTAFNFNASPALGSGQAPTGRATPDLSFNADPQTGYALYDPQFEAGYGTDILQYGGTSFVAPQLNATAVVFASAVGHRIGFWNPTIYAAAKSSASPFTPLDGNKLYSGGKYLSATTVATGKTATLPGSFSNNNLYYTGNKGTAYNAASGLGYANLTKLESAFAKG